MLGALVAALLAVHVEKWCRRRVPEALDVLVTPTLTVLVSGLVTLFGLMYVARPEVSTAHRHVRRLAARCTAAPSRASSWAASSSPW